jgi:hypothetical protein
MPPHSSSSSSNSRPLMPPPQQQVALWLLEQQLVLLEQQLAQPGDAHVQGVEELCELRYQLHACCGPTGRIWCRMCCS